MQNMSGWIRKLPDIEPRESTERSRNREQSSVFPVTQLSAKQEAVLVRAIVGRVFAIVAGALIARNWVPAMEAPVSMWQGCACRMPYRVARVFLGALESVGTPAERRVQWGQ